MPGDNDLDTQIAALAPRFLANRIADVVRMRAALALAEFETIRRAAHAMKGSGAGYGFPEVSRLGALLEDAARGGRADEVGRMIAELDAYLIRAGGDAGRVAGLPGAEPRNG